MRPDHYDRFPRFLSATARRQLLHVGLQSSDAMRGLRDRFAAPRPRSNSSRVRMEVPHVPIDLRDRILKRARKSALNKDPHLRSSPILGEGKNGKAVMQGSACREGEGTAGSHRKEPGFFGGAALNDTRRRLLMTRIDGGHGGAPHLSFPNLRAKCRPRHFAISFHWVQGSPPARRKCETHRGFHFQLSCSASI